MYLIFSIFDDESSKRNWKCNSFLMHMWRVKYACDEKSRIYYYNILKGLLKILDIYLCILLLQAILDYISVSILCSHRYIKYISFWLFERSTRSCSFHWIARNTKKFLCKVYKGGSWCLQCNLCLILPRGANLFNFDVKLSNCTNTWPESLFADIFQRYLFIV